MADLYNAQMKKIFDDITNRRATGCDLKRDNANINGDTAMGAMLQYGSSAVRKYYLNNLVPHKFAQAHQRGDIHIHDLDFYGWTTTCTQIELSRLFARGFDTGHGHLRQPQSIGSCAALCAIAIQSNQNDQHGGQSIVDFDRAMAEGVRKTYARYMNEALAIQEEIGVIPQEPKQENWRLSWAMERTVRDTYQAMEGLIHNLNTMHSRAGAQVPFSSVNYGTDTSWEGRLVIQQMLLATEAGLGNGETPIFPIQIFRVKEGVNYNPDDPNYDLFRLAIRVSAKRLFPNFAFLDAPFNLCYYRKDDPATEVAYMGCRTRVLGNVFDPTKEISPGRGNLSFTSINLPRVALLAKGASKDVTRRFFVLLKRTASFVLEQLLERMRVQGQRTARNFPFLMGNGVWMGSEALSPDDEVGEVLRNGTLSIGFIGLAEALTVLCGHHHGESEYAQRLGLTIIRFLRVFCDRASREKGLNVTLLATPAESLSGRFLKLDRGRFGVIAGVTDREYYTNSFHIPVWYKIAAADKIRLEAPYHALTNAGHISYVELDGDVSQNLEAFESLLRLMKESGIGYGSINHPVDRDPACGYNGVIGDACPKCGRTEDTGSFERIRRITGYLVGTTDRWNDAKRAEERDRVKHSV